MNASRNLGADVPCKVSLEFSGTDLWFDPPLCPTCGSKVGKYEAQLYKVLGPHRKGFSLSITSDGFYLVSKKLLPALAECKGVTFVPLERGYSVIQFHRKVDLEVPEAMTRAKNLCPTCGQYASRAINLGYRRKLAAHEAPIGDMEIVCSKIEWGSIMLRTPDMLVGNGVRQILIDSRIKGLSLREMDYPGNGVVYPEPKDQN